MRVLSVVGARPQLVKLAAVHAAMRDTAHEHVIVHTGQHYDLRMSDVFFAGLNIPDPDVHLGVGSGSHGAQTGAILTDIEPVITDRRPDWVLVYGDTNSTLAGTLAAVKQHVRVAHLEAGLRSFNRRMPEEHNRVLTDHAADLLLAPTETAKFHLTREGLGDRTVVVGDVMVDVCHRVRDAVLAGEHPTPELPTGIDPSAPYLVGTLHRPDNTDDPVVLSGILGALAALPIPVALLAHPRLVARAEQHGLDLNAGALQAGPPLAYADMVAAVLGSRGVVTDSGGLQKEAFLLGRPCTTVRTETEWTETVDAGWNILIARPDLEDPQRGTETATRQPPRGPRPTPYGEGSAGASTIAALESTSR